MFGDLFGGGCAAELDGCSLSNNRLNGLLVRCEVDHATEQ